MNKSNARSAATRLRTGALALLLSVLLVPVLAYIGGSLVVGDYEGNSGMLGYLLSIYGDAARGRWLAWILILAPVLIIATWTLVIRLIRRAGDDAEESNN